MEYYDFIHYTVKISTLNTFSFSEKKVQPKCLCMLHHCARGCGSYMFSLVSTYVVCERLSVMHEPAGVVENLVQNSTVYPYSAIQNTPPPENENCHKSWHFDF